MRVLVVNGFSVGEPIDVVDDAIAILRAGGHETDRLDLAPAFDRFMSAEERDAYHGDEPLITEEARSAAAALQATEGIVICYPVTHGTSPPRVKSWQERVFVLDVAFRFKPSGVITGALDHLKRACVIGWSTETNRSDGRRNAHGPSIARSFFLSSNRACRSRYVAVDEQHRHLVGRALRRW